ncbi:si:ch211-15b10.6 [Plectropomus leopardus]|uniref:si:ch211-15b10.6 n=1 Tax=Plectropomus leopardus TaxID=160734 RepID=UPI001C4C55E0|nr:si:ch211-15b10.6 [Plectropomus leopardus]
MSVSQTMETEEDLLTCLYIKFYHPRQQYEGLYGLLPMGTKSKHPADEPLRLGRDPQSCTFSLVDMRVSRKQLCVYAFRTPQSPDMLFCIQNLSKKGRLSVNGAMLGFLERMDLPNKALIRFGEYEMLIIQEPGEAMGKIEVDFEVLAVPPSRETCTRVPPPAPVMEMGSYGTSCPGELRVSAPLENDETIMCFS